MNRKTQETQTIKIRISTHDQLKVLAALRRESMMETLDHLVQEDLERIRKETKRNEDEDI